MIYALFPSDWYWVVAADDTQVFSSASAGYVPADAEALTNWTALGNAPTPITSEAELAEVLSFHGLGLGPLAALGPRRQLPKSVVQERMNTIGKLGVAFAALQSNPLAFGRWFAPNWPNVYADDADLVGLLTAIGCTEAEIAEVTAP